MSKKNCKNLINRLQFIRAKKVIFGAELSIYNKWLSTNKAFLNLTNRNDFAKYWKPNSRSNFLAEHVWEHLTEDEAEQANINCWEFLKAGGRLRIAVPDAFHPDPNYIEYARPGGIGFGSDDHKVFYNYKTLSEQLKKAGFKVELLEYWDEDRQFHFQEWSSEDGHIRRSKRYDPRNQDGSLTYTSLIVDAIKP